MSPPLRGDFAMVSHLFFYQLGLVALVWVCLILHWVWPSACAPAPPTPPQPTPLRRQRRHEPQPFVGLTTKPPCDACEHRSEPPPQTPAAPPPRLVPTRGGGAAATSTPRGTSARTLTVPIAAGWAGAISAPMAIPVAVPGGSCCVSSVVAIFSRPSAPSFMASAPLSSLSYASS